MSFIKSVLIDCGRGWYSPAQIKEIIDIMAKCKYDYLMLGFGNDGLRFILDDMAVTADGCTYDSDKITKGIINSNDKISPDSMGQFTEKDMDEIIEFAGKNNIEIIPMMDVPGHATAITGAMSECNIENASYIYNTEDSSLVNLNNLSVNIENEAAVNFTLALVKKYIDYFDKKGCKYFNFGFDEYGGNASTLTEDVLKKISDFCCKLCTMLPSHIEPMAFTDVLSKCKNYPDNLIGINWIGGSFEGHKMLNANCGWYYVLGNTNKNTESGWSTYETAMKNAAEIPVTKQIKDDSMPIGFTFAVWNDLYYSPEKYISIIKEIMESIAKNNPDFF
ncbi:MAG: family 20 glycosylhydrolase [Clostridia bacterium]|nr:family 20 glycosylhydrolase [Clostridia bacterium]